MTKNTTSNSKRVPVTLENHVGRDVGKILRKAAEDARLTEAVREAPVKVYDMGPKDYIIGPAREDDVSSNPFNDDEPRGSVFAYMGNAGERIRGYFSNLKDKIKSKFKEEETSEKTAAENDELLSPAKERWYYKRGTKIAGFAAAIVASLGLAAAGLYKNINHNAAEESLQYLRSSHTIHSNRAVAADERVMEIRDDIDALNKRLQNTTLDTTHTYQEGENRWVVAKAYAEMDNGGTPLSDTQVWDATNALCKANEVNELNDDYAWDIEFGVPMKEWTPPTPPKTGNPNYAPAGAKEDTAANMPNTVKAFNQIRAAIENERVADVKALDRAEADREKEKGITASLSDLVRRQQKEATGSDGTNYLRGAGVLSAATAAALAAKVIYDSNKKKKYSLETILGKLEANPDKIVDSRKTDRYMGVLAQNYNQSAGKQVLSKNDYSKATRQAVAARLYACEDVVDNAKNNTKYMSIKDIAKFTGLSEYAVEKSGKKIANRSEIRAEQLQNRMEKAVDYHINRLSNSEIAEKIGVSERTVGKYLANYKPAAKI